MKRRNQEDIKKSLEDLTRDFQNESLFAEHQNLKRQVISLKQTQIKLHDDFMKSIERHKNLRQETSELFSVSIRVEE